MKKNKILFILIAFAICNMKAQEVEIKVDASKPTNLYTQVNTVLEYQSHKFGKDVYGTRINVQKAFNPDNLLLVELPFLYNSGTEKFGLSDMRVRYFYAAKRNLSKTFIAMVPFVDISIPTGKFDNGLGTSRWSFTGGLVMGMVLTKKIALFPGVGYAHITEPNAYEGESNNGVNIQTNVSIKFNENFFVFVNPILTIFDKSNWSGEFNFNYMAKPNKLKLNLGYYPLFTQDIHTIRTGATFYF